MSKLLRELPLHLITYKKPDDVVQSEKVEKLQFCDWKLSLDAINKSINIEKPGAPRGRTAH